MDEAMRCLVPAKAMLFGEYGVLAGYPAVAVTFWQEFFAIEATFRPEKNAKLTVISDFFAKGPLVLALDNLEKEDPSLDKDTLFFRAIFSPWAPLLQGQECTLQIKRSFSPSLGFGSSSALIAGINLLLQSYFYPENKGPHSINPEVWFKMRRALHAIQKAGGSGYDIAIQYLSAQCQREDKKIAPLPKSNNLKMVPSSQGNGVTFWRYQLPSSQAPMKCEDGQSASAQELLPRVEKFTPAEHVELYGCFVKTGHYSDTSAALTLFSQNPAQKEHYGLRHGALALAFLEDSSCRHTGILMQESLKIAEEQGILYRPAFLAHAPTLRYKTMGAGRGDSLWFLHTRAELLGCGIAEENIAFSFATHS